MPEVLYTEDGEEREVPTQDELEELKKTSQQKEEEAQNAQKELEETKEKLSKLENKDFNFKKLRDMNEEEKSKLSEVERQLKEKQEELEEQQNQFTSQIIESYKNEALNVLVGQDEEVQKEVLENYDRIMGNANNREEVYKKMREAFNMTGRQAPSVNPLYQAHNMGGNSGGSANKKSSGASVNKDLAKKFSNITDEDLEKYQNKNNS